MSEAKLTFIHTDRMDAFLSRITPHIPFSYLWIYKKSLYGGKTVLDVGCGDGVLMSRIARGRDLEITGIDIFSKSLKAAKRKGVYSTLLKGDVVKKCEQLARNRKKYDIVFCSQVIEHITRKDGINLLSLMDKLAEKKVVVATPIGYMNQPEVFIGNNPYQYHKSGWSVKEFVRRGYRVNGVGFRLGWSETGFSRGTNSLVVIISVMFSFLLSPLAYYFPNLAAGMMCIKNK